MTAHPTQNDFGVFERPLYGQLYFLDPDEAVNERVNHPLNSGITTSMMKLLEFIIRAHNRYVQGYIMMREVEDEMNRLTSAQGLPPPYVKLLFRVPDQVDRRRFNIPACNENIISSNNLIDEVFGNCLANGNYDGMKDRVILAPLNKDVEKIYDDISEGLCNDVRLIVTCLCNHIIKEKIVNGEQSGKEVHIPRIALDSSKGQLRCTM
ncbi:unnamed protein product [Parnassius apollo]|uniref:(apollo) hypothetical protein n=1 Tax=Parnassius apollo TaxID=110799 RepID=A0A8S3XQD9_PARAO|nr:unnamed protein product [Parnassius apollo]